jgi:hypothetical protein
MSYRTDSVRHHSQSRKGLERVLATQTRLRPSLQDAQPPSSRSTSRSRCPTITGSVKIGRYITQDIFLSFEPELGADNGNTVGVDYNLTRRRQLKGTGSDTGESTLDLLWRLDY